MKTRVILTMAASALTLIASPAIKAVEATAPAHAQNTSDPEKADTLVYSATKTLIESFGELSKTASKLSETALKLLEAQESLDAKKNGGQQTQIKSAPAKVTSTDRASSVESTDNSSISLKEISEEIIQISNEISPAYIPALRVGSENQATITDNTNEKYANSKVYISDEVTTKEVNDSSIWYLPDNMREDGQYLWIPDKDMTAVRAILNGETPTQTKSKVNLNEMTYWHGDSIPMAIPTKRLGRFDRKLYNWLIYPKGLWHIGLTANYGELNTEDNEFLSLIQDVDLKGKIYSIKPSVSYFLRNNVCVGLRLAFTKGEMGINSFKVDIDEDMSFNLHDIKYTSDSYSAAVFIQQYFGLSRRGRFAVFNEAEVSVGTGNSHFIRPFDGEIRDTRTKTQTFNINYSPGISIMMMKNAAFNLSFGIFGFHLKDEKQWENGEEAGSRFTSGINFRFNLFNINFGVSIII